MTMRRQAERDLLTVALAVSAGVHAALVPEHWRERPALGVGFALAAAALAATAAALQLSPRRLPAAAAAVVLGGLTFLYLLSRTHGLPVAGREAWDAVGIATQVVQLVGIALAVPLAPPLRHISRTPGEAHAHA
jgi:hypothetical protein